MKKFRRLFLLAPLAVAPAFMYSCNDTAKKEGVKNEESSAKTTNNTETTNPNNTNNSDSSAPADNSQPNQGDSNQGTNASNSDSSVAPSNNSQPNQGTSSEGDGTANSDSSSTDSAQPNQGNSDASSDSSSNTSDQSEGNAPVENTQSAPQPASGTVEPATENREEQTLTPSQRVNSDNNNIISLKEGVDYSDFYKYIDFSKTTGKPSSLIYNYQDGTITTSNSGKNGYTEKTWEFNLNRANFDNSLDYKLATHENPLWNPSNTQKYYVSKFLNFTYDEANNTITVSYKVVYSEPNQIEESSYIISDAVFTSVLQLPTQAKETANTSNTEAENNTPASEENPPVSTDTGSNSTENTTDPESNDSSNTDTNVEETRELTIEDKVNDENNNNLIVLRNGQDYSDFEAYIEYLESNSKDKTLDFNIEKGYDISTYSKYTGTKIYFDFNSSKFNDEHFRLTIPSPQYKETKSKAGIKYYVDRKVAFEYNIETRTLLLSYKVIYFNAGPTEKSVPEKSDIIISERVYTSTIVLPNGIATVENTETPSESAEARN
ncbi:hypothetical protein [Mycoplasmopsis gallinacea]|uniref:Uncharacterized protein n=1 Tax=Mycoplasmopsis gallinacea TaxID=29556 RepID=A0A6H0V5V5_9BACT|nr:hypothetical protein [Mycoplasmopsis gallinacea]QIW61885.1 hypothetical protein GOQ20_00130 [Mycoplasmopsis gallinacea]